MLLLFACLLSRVHKCAQIIYHLQNIMTDRLVSIATSCVSHSRKPWHLMMSALYGDQFRGKKFRRLLSSTFVVSLRETHALLKLILGMRAWKEFVRWNFALEVQRFATGFTNEWTFLIKNFLVWSGQRYSFSAFVCGFWQRHAVLSPSFVLCWNPQFRWVAALIYFNALCKVRAATKIVLSPFKVNRD